MTFGIEPSGRWLTPEELRAWVDERAAQILNRKQKEKDVMGHRMSRDRMEFRPGVYTSKYYYGGNAANPNETHRFTREALVKALNITAGEAEHMIFNNTLIRCRPSQFARFIAIRHDLGIKCNGIKCLDLKWIEVEPVRPEPVDVSTNPARHDRS